MNVEPLKVLIVDDSRIFRAAMQDALDGKPGVRVVGSVWSGEKALEFVRLSPPDLVTLDVNMPGRGGLDTLSDLQEFNASRPGLPPVGVLLVSALTSRGAATTVEGLQRGAFDFIRKPDGADEKVNAALLQQQLIEKIDLFALRRNRPASVLSALAMPTTTSTASRPGRFHCVAIGVSTGGPAALARLLPVVTKQSAVPILIVQHMTTGLTGHLAESLAKKCDARIVEASEGEQVKPGWVYIAPAGRHMIVRNHNARVIIGLNDQPPENGFRPSVDVFFRSVAGAYPHAALAAILTGMGSDGAKGLAALKRSGGYVIAQDEASSVVWGMPGAAVAANVVDEVLPLERIGPAVLTLLGSRISPCN